MAEVLHTPKKSCRLPSPRFLPKICSMGLASRSAWSLMMRWCPRGILPQHLGRLTYPCWMVLHRETERKPTISRFPNFKKNNKKKKRGSLGSPLPIRPPSLVRPLTCSWAQTGRTGGRKAALGYGKTLGSEYLGHAAEEAE